MSIKALMVFRTTSNRYPVSRMRRPYSTGVAAITLFLLPSVAMAQTVPPPALPESRVISPGGVDMRSGLYVYSATDLSIGDEKKVGITLKRGPSSGPQHGPNSQNTYLDGFSQFSHNWDVHLSSTPFPKNMHTVSITAMGISYSFLTGPSFSNPSEISKTGWATLQATQNGSAYTFRLTTASGMTVDVLGSTTVITHPDGVVYTLYYSGSTGGQSGVSTLQRVVSNAGYELVFQYAATGSWPLIGKACVVNLTQMQAVTTCPAGAVATTYTYNSGVMASATDPTGAQWTYGRTVNDTQGDYTDTFYKPGQSTPYLSVYYTLGYDQEAVSTQTFADGRTISYSWYLATYGCPYGSTDCNDKNFPVGASYTENGVAQTQVGFYIGPWSYGSPPTVSPTPTSVVDPLNRSYGYQYCEIGTQCGYINTMYGSTTPEGVQENYTRDRCFNLAQVNRTPKSGSSLSSTTVSATYGNCGASTIAQDSPTAIVDANGKETDLTYDPVHGGVLTEAGPADPNGVRPVKFHTYVQRYAWISNGGGGFVHAASPIWLPATESTCRTTATNLSTGACAGGTADQVVTAYDYGPDTGAAGNNLLLRGVAVTADGQTRRTCYFYDVNGRKIAETKPLGTANLTACP